MAIRQAPPEVQEAAQKELLKAAERLVKAIDVTSNRMAHPKPGARLEVFYAKVDLQRVILNVRDVMGWTE